MNKYMQLGNKYISGKKLRAAMVMINMMLASALCYIIITIALGEYIHARQLAEADENYYVSYVNLTEEQKKLLENYANVEASVTGWQQYGLHLHDFYSTENFGAAGFTLTSLETMDQSLFGYTMVEGRAPEKPGEIMVHEKTFCRFGDKKKLGDTVTAYAVEMDALGNEISRSSQEYVLTGVYANERQQEDQYSYFGYAIPATMENEEVHTYVRFKRKYHWKKDAKALAEAINLQPGQGGCRYDLNFNSLMVCYMQNEMVLVSLVIILMVSALVLYFCMVLVRSLMSTNVIDKLRDYTILKSMGATNKQLRKIFMRENLIEGVIAYVCGTLFGQLLIQVIFMKTFRIHTLSVKYYWAALLFNALFLWLTIELASIEPFYLMKKSSLIDTLGRRDMIKQARKRGKKEKKPGLFYKKMRIEGQYAYKNIQRNKKGFWNPVASFTLSILLATMLLCLVTNFIHNIGDISGGSLPYKTEDAIYDIQLYYSSDEDGNLIDKGSKAAAKAAVSKWSAVTELDEMAYCFLRISPEESKLTVSSAVQEALQVNAKASVVEVYLLTQKELEWLNDYLIEGGDACEMLKDGGILLQTRYLDGKDKEQQLFSLKAGDSVLIEDMGFRAERTLEDNAFVSKADNCKYEAATIKGTFRANSLTRGYPQIAVMSYDYVLRTYGEAFLDACSEGVYINVDEKQFDADAFDVEVAKQSAFSSWFYMDLSKGIKTESNVFMILGYFVIGFLLLLGVLSVLSTMINESLQRKKENAILRAIGLSRSGLNKMLIMEKMWMGLTAWVIGTVAGLLLSWLFTISIMEASEAKFYIAWYIPVLTLAVILAVMGLLSWIMIFTVRKLSISQEVKSEG